MNNYYQFFILFSDLKFFLCKMTNLWHYLVEVSVFLFYMMVRKVEQVNGRTLSGGSEKRVKNGNLRIQKFFIREKYSSKMRIQCQQFPTRSRVHRKSHLKYYFYIFQAKHLVSYSVDAHLRYYNTFPFANMMCGKRKAAIMTK